MRRPALTFYGRRPPVWGEQFGRACQVGGLFHGFVLVSHAADWVYTTLAAVNLSWAQELATYMFVWMAKFGAALGVRTGIHVGVDVLVEQI